MPWDNDPIVQSAPKIVSYEDAVAPDPSAARNFLSAALRIPGAIAGAPRAVLYDFPNWLSGQTGKAPTDPLARVENAVLPSAEVSTVPYSALRA
jgi:hypothetical protein